MCIDPPDLSDRNLEKVDVNLTDVKFNKRVKYRCRSPNNVTTTSEVFFEKDRELEDVSLWCLPNGSFSQPLDDYKCVESTLCQNQIVPYWIVNSSLMQVICQI